MKIHTGKWTEKELDDILRRSSEIANAGERIAYLSRLFLGTGYKESTLQGGPETPEELVINLAALDCFTFVDYIEAMRLSQSFAGFVEKLKKVRYRQGKVSFSGRKHFFTDWRESDADFVADVTGKVGKGRVIRVHKVLNDKEDGTKWVSGIAAVKREFGYIPAPLDDDVLAGLMAGDYAGVYSAANGLDVSHVGIVVRDGGRLFFRHASSRLGTVVDEDLREYFSEKRGMIVLRPK